MAILPPVLRLTVLGQVAVEGQGVSTRSRAELPFSPFFTRIGNQELQTTVPADYNIILYRLWV
jgi:hypothetical protein